jgi:hypothetical protein
MPDHNGERAKQQMRELGQAVRNAARELDRAYPNTMRGDRIVSDFRQHTNRLVPIGSQQGNRPLEENCCFPVSSDQAPSGLIVGVGLLAVIVFVVLLLILLP